MNVPLSSLLRSLDFMLVMGGYGQVDGYECSPNVYKSTRRVSQFYINSVTNWLHVAET
jgi:hypothetical protein